MHRFHHTSPVQAPGNSATQRKKAGSEGRHVVCLCAGARRCCCVMSGSEIVVVTGFGPFREFVVNPSWRAAQGLKSAGFGQHIHVCIKEVPVSYRKTKQIIDEIWQTLRPKFVVHLGVARGAKVILLEQTGRNAGYADKDVCGFCPEGHRCVEGGPEALDSVVDMRVVSKAFRQAETTVLCSRDAGRYVCEFAYFCSLYHGEGRAALIHIPPSGTIDSLVPLLRSVIRSMLDTLERRADK